MDELDVIARAGGAPAPTDEVTARHRAQLGAAMRGDVFVGAPAHGRARGRSRVVLAAAAAVAVALAGVGAVWATRSGDEEVRVASGASSGEEGAVATCGTEPPVVVLIPSPMFLAEQTEGPSPDAKTPPADGQFVRHWEDDDLSMELRWPADDDLGVEIVDDGETPAPVATLVVLVEEAADGQVREATLALRLSDQRPACQWLQIRLVGHPEVPVETISDLAEHLPAGDRSVVTPHGIRADSVAVRRVQDVLIGEESTELVRASSSSPALMSASTCRAPADMTPPPNKGGPVSGSPVHPTPEDALAAFLDAQGTPGSPVADPTLPRLGYVRYDLLDGSVAFTYEPENSFYVVVIHVIPAGDGWSVARWESTGC